MTRARSTERYVRASARVLLEIKKTLLYLFFPAPCLACGSIDRSLERPLGLCLGCRGRLVRIRPPCCPTCARPLAAAFVPAGYRCGRCRRRPPTIAGLTACWIYQEPLDCVIRALKFSRLRFLGDQLGRELGCHLKRAPPPVDLVVPVPLYWRRRLERGYNQAEQIARVAAQTLDLPVVLALRRRRSTRPQTELPRGERRANLRRAFACPQPKRVARRRILLIDDVTTTGATLREAAGCLRRAGAGPIFAAVIGRTPEPGEVRSGGKVVRKVSLTTSRQGPILEVCGALPAR